MPGKANRPGDAIALRRRAEQLAREKATPSPEDFEALSPAETRRMLHELRLHQIELEMQNEELRRAQAELDAARARYFDLYDLAPVGYVTLSQQGQILETNLTAAIMLGVSRSALVKRLLTRFILKEDQDIFYLQCRQLFEKGEPQVFDLRVVKNDGTQFWAQLAATAAQDDDGAPVCRVVLTDITGRKQMEEALRESEKRFRALIENSSDAITLLDAKGITLYDSPAAPGMLGYAPEDWIGRDVFTLIHPDDLPKIRGIFQNLVETPGVRVNSAFRVHHKSGSWLWIEMVATNLLAIPGVKAIVLNYRDITERKEAQARIRRQLAHLTAMSAIDRVIAANFDLKLILSEILSHVTMELDIDAAEILILNSNSQMLEFGAERGFRAKSVRKAQVRLGESYAGRAALERQLVQIPNLSAEPDNPFLTSLLTGEDFVCYYAVPLIAKGQVKGVLEVFHRTALEPDPEWFDFLNALAGQAAIAIENSTLFESQQRSNLELSLAYDATIEGWSRALDLRDKETEGHSLRVTEMTVKLARAFGLSEAELVQVRWGALLHDIGKMGVPDRILQKPEPLADEEWAVMKKHPDLAYEMLAPIRYLRQALDIPYCHHEKWDGSGYPRGLKGEQIPLAARIFAVVDAWDALKSDRPYRAGWTEEKVLEHIRTSSGTHFDPQVVEAFITLLPTV